MHFVYQTKKIAISKQGCIFIVVNIWSGSKTLMKVILRQERILGFRITLMKGFDPLHMLTSIVWCECRGRGETSVICLFCSGPEESRDHPRPHNRVERERCGVHEVYSLENKLLNLDLQRNIMAPTSFVISMSVMTLFWGLIGGVIPWFIPKGPNRG